MSIVVSSKPRIVSVKVTSSAITAGLADGRTVSVPLAWSWRLSEAVRDGHPEVPWKQIAGMRHVLVHDYFGVNWARVYETARDHVPPLRPRIQAILDSLPAD